MVPQGLVAAAALLVWLAAAVASRPAWAGPPIGININYAGDWVPELLFADAFKQSRNWTTPAGATVPIDANGWPAQDASIYVWAGQTLDMSGTYALSFGGQATVTASGGTLSNQLYDSATNVTTATVTMGNTDLHMVFANTRRTAASPTNTGVTNVSLMRPATYGGTTSYPPTANFTTPLKNLVGKFGVIRFMDYLATNANAQVNWSDRVAPAYASYAVADPAYGWQGKGSPWEFAVLLCNETGRDMWVCLPVGATDTYVANVARLIAFGSDGVNPYAGPQSHPIYPPLNPDLKVYVEFSNEVWNTASAFTQSGTNHASAIAEVAAGGSPLNFDGDTNDWNWAARRTAKRTVEISNLFRGVFGDGAMISRVRPVLESQEGYVAFWLLQQTHLLEDYYNNSNRVATPHPPSYYIYGGGGSAYYNPDNSSAALSLLTIWASETFDVSVWAPVCRSESGYTLPVYGRRVAYEGGPSMDNTGHSEAVKAQAWADPRMTTCVSGHQTTWNQTGGDLLCYFNSTGDYQWSFTHDPAVLGTPKLLGIDAINGAPPAVGTLGVAIPGTVSAAAYSSPETWAGADPHNLSASGNWTWTGYVVNNAAGGVFFVKLSAGSAGAANAADLYVDGALVGTIAIPNTGGNGTYRDTAPIATRFLPPGTHGVLLKARSGGFGVGSITFTSTAIAPPALSDEALVRWLYADVLGRPADAGGLASFEAALAAGSPASSVLGELLGSAEYSAWQFEPVIRLYHAALDRMPDYAGLRNWSDALHAGSLTLIGAADQFAASPEFSSKYGALDNAAYVEQLYRNVLHREADSAGLSDWVSQLDSGASRGAVLVGFSESGEFKADTAGPVEIERLYGLLEQRMPTDAEMRTWSAFLAGDSQIETLVAQAYPGGLADADFVTAVFHGFLCREADAGALDAFTAVLAAGTATHGSLVDSVLNSAEFNLYAGPVSRLYLSAFQRIPDQPGLINWVDDARSGNPLESVADTFAASQEFMNRYGGSSDIDYVTQLYGNVLGRAPDAGGLAYWTALLGAGSTRGQVLIGFSQSAEGIALFQPTLRTCLSYFAFFGSPPTSLDLDYWADYLATLTDQMRELMIDAATAGG